MLSEGFLSELSLEQLERLRTWETCWSLRNHFFIINKSKSPSLPWALGPAWSGHVSAPMYFISLSLSFTPLKARSHPCSPFKPSRLLSLPFFSFPGPECSPPPLNIQIVHSLTSLPPLLKCHLPQRGLPWSHHLKWHTHPPSLSPYLIFFSEHFLFVSLPDILLYIYLPIVCLPN